MHIALIPDGNRRFMRKVGIADLAKSYGMGIRRFYDFLSWCSELGVKEVTIYALSTENIENRTKEELRTLFRVFSEQAKAALSDKRIKEKNVRVNICGNREYLLNGVREPELAKELVKNLSALEHATEKNSGSILNMAIAYGGRQEITNAASEVAKLGLPITEENIRKHLWVKSYPDIVIRTAEDRLSNFLVWQSAYSEIYFPNKLWQEFTKEDLKEIIDDYNGRERRFGK